MHNLSYEKRTDETTLLMHTARKPGQLANAVMHGLSFVVCSKLLRNNPSLASTVTSPSSPCS
jgi:hypothetical protein